MTVTRGVTVWRWIEWINKRIDSLNLCVEQNSGQFELEKCLLFHEEAEYQSSSDSCMRKLSEMLIARARRKLDVLVWLEETR